MEDKLNEGKNILITGGAGFIGSHLCDALLERGDSVVVLDNLSTGNRKNIEHLVGNPSFELIEGSILDVEIVDKVVLTFHQFQLILRHL